MNEIKAFIEIIKDSKYKYEWCKTLNQLVLDRPLNQSIPANYGFIPKTLCGDNDPLDVFVITKWPIIQSSSVKIEILGMFECIDNGSNDPKIVAQLENESSINKWSNEINKIEHYLNTYKEGFKVIKYHGKKEALKELQKSVNQFYMSNE